MESFYVSTIRRIGHNGDSRWYPAKVSVETLEILEEQQRRFKWSVMEDEDYELSTRNLLLNLLTNHTTSLMARSFH